MIKPVKIINSVVDIAQKKVSNATDAITPPVTRETSQLTDASAELLRSYQGIKVKKLFASFPDFVKSFKSRLEELKDCIPDGLYKKLQTMTDNNDFSLSKAISEYYSGLNECKNLNDVKKLYPEINVPDLNFEKEIANEIKAVIPETICKTVDKLQTKEAKLKYINDYFDKIISRQVNKWEIYPAIQKIKSDIANEIIENKFRNFGTILPEGVKLENNKMPLRYRLMNTPDREQAMLEIFREHYVQGKNITDICIKTTDGKDIYAHRLKHSLSFSDMDKNFRKFINSAENNAKEFQKLSTLNKSEISSAIMTQTWRSSKLRADLGNETAYKKDWSNVKAVWQKTMFPETTYFPTDKLIEGYLVNLYKNGKRQADTANPLLKYLENPAMDKTKISLIKRLYNSSKHLDLDKQILNSPGYKEFKAQFDIEGMTKTIEDIEEHYKNAFFKLFWTDERKARFAKALNENREIAGKNVEISDNILIEAMNNVFEEIN